MDYTLITLFVVLFIILLCAAYIASRYKKSQPNEVIIVTGGMMSGPYVQENKQTHTKVKVVKGGGVFVWPIIQQYDYYSLDTFNVDVTVEDIMTVNMVPVDASANAVLRPSSDPQLIAVAAEKTLGLDDAERQNQMEQVVLGGVREVLAGLTPTEANDRSKFAAQVVESIKSTFDNMGLEITAFQITKLSDKNGYFESLSAKDIAEKNSEARQAQAQADKEAQLVEAKNRQEAQEAALKAQKAIAASKRDTDVAAAQYQAEVNKEQEKAKQAGLIARAEQESILQEKNIAVKENELKATKIAGLMAHCDYSA